MRHAFEDGGELETATRSRVVLAFDFDGTLAPIVDDHRDAAMRPRTRELVARLCELYPCAVISGRMPDDVAARLEGLSLRRIVGNHGIATAAGHTGLAAARAQLAVVLSCQGVEIEDKQASLAVHYRRSRDPSTPRVIAEAVARLPPSVRVLHGKCVLEIVPTGAATKGDALAAICADEGVPRAIFVGDDRTDEDAFGHELVLGVRVGASRWSKALYFVRDQHEVDDLLAWLIARR